MCLETYQGRVVRPPTPADDIAAITNVPDENHRNSSEEAKYLEDLLKDYFNQVGALTGQDDRI